MAWDWEENENQGNQIDNLFGEEAKAQSEPQVPMTERDFDQDMNEAEKRLEVAQHYKLLLQDSLFQARSDASERVETEIRMFIKERLGVLLGIRADKAPTSNIFSESEVDTLKKFAILGAEGPAVLEAVMGRLSKKIEKAAKPKDEPALRTVKEVAKPALKQREQPKLKQSVQQQSPTKKPEAPSKSTKGGLKVPKQYENDPTLKIEGNKIFIQASNAAGEHLWEKIDGETRPLYKDITPAARPTGIKPLPIPTGANLELAMQQQAQKVLQETQENGNSLIISQGGLTR